MTRALKKARSRARITWAATAGLSGAVAFMAYTDGVTQWHIMLMGMIFAGYVVASRTIAKRGKDLSTVLLAGVGASVVFWAEPLQAVLYDVLLGWESSGLIAEGLSSTIALPVAIGVVGVVLSVFLHFSTSKTTTLFYTLAISGVAAVAPLAPEYQREAIAGAAVFWQVMMSGSLCHWALWEFQQRQGRECPYCGFNLEHITTPLCPSCQRRLPSAGPLNPTAYSEHVHNPFAGGDAEAEAEQEAA